MKTSLFLQRLQEEAALQSKLNENRVLPRQLDGVTSFIGTHPWQVISVLALISAVILEVL